MKIGVVSDVHNNVAALEYALDNLRQCDLVLSLGDLVSDYSVAPEIIALARRAGLTGIAGNHEKSILLHPGSTIRGRLAETDLDYLQSLPARRDLTVDGRTIVVAHGAPWDEPGDYRCQYIYASDAPSLQRVGTTDADIVLLGHTHHAMSIRVGRVLVVNPGSAGEARNRAGTLSYAELDFGAGVARTFQIQPGVRPQELARAEM